jgi:hypothetical protein
MALQVGMDHELKKLLETSDTVTALQMRLDKSEREREQAELLLKVGLLEVGPGDEW